MDPLNIKLAKDLLDRMEDLYINLDCEYYDTKDKREALDRAMEAVNEAIGEIMKGFDL